MTLSKKDQIAYWSSEEFLNNYFQKLEFDEPYARVYGTIALAWVTSPWRHHIRVIVFKFIRSYIKKHKKLPQGKVTFKVNWKTKKPNWLVDCLRQLQVVTFPGIEDTNLNPKLR
jgi:hypothetical protein